MQNPWLGFQNSESMVHPLDLDVVIQHNISSKPDYKYLLHLAPEPWIGDLGGKLVVLYSNPGATKDNVNHIFQPLHSEVLKKTIDNLNQRNSQYPHFHFDPHLKESEGAKWFESKYKWVIDQTSRQAVAKTLVTCELSPYHSLKWKIPKSKLPTQEFTYRIVRQAIARNAVILLARTPKIWLENVPELKSYSRVFRPNSINASVSPNNYLQNFKEIIKVIENQ